MKKAPRETRGQFFPTETTKGTHTAPQANLVAEMPHQRAIILVGRDPAAWHRRVSGGAGAQVGAVGGEPRLLDHLVGGGQRARWSVLERHKPGSWEALSPARRQLRN
jgi:hypothetical protein